MSEPQGKFIRIRCGKCKNEQVIFTKAATKVDCLMCQEPLAKPSGGKVKLIAQALEQLE
jgi:small subunit ribosomal protein S27e